MQAGRVVEFDAPLVLAARADSLYARMRDADRAVAAEVWRSPLWRRIEIRRGRISSDAPAAMEASVP
jgi:hypothetical protein